MHIAILVADSNGCYPVPASKEGAVSTLIELLVKSNSEQRKADLTIISYYDKKAQELSKKYRSTNFIWIKTSLLTKFIDKITFNILKFFFKKKKLLSYKSIFSLLSYIRQSSSILKHHSFDKVILENNVPLAWSIKLSHYKGEYYYHFHNIPRLNAKCMSVFENCTGFLCVSQFVANCITSKDSAIGEISPNKVNVLYNCIDCNKFFINKNSNSFNIKNKYNIDTEDKIVIFVGRMSSEKGISELLSAMKLVSYPNVKVLIVGSYLHNIDVKDDYQQSLYQLAKELKDKIIFTGYISQQELPNLYNIADVAVLPSMWDEPAGLTMVEAMACGVPLITTNSGGIPEYVADGGIILERNSDLIENIAINIDRILYKNVSINTDLASRRMNTYFNSNKYLDNFLDAITE